MHDFDYDAMQKKRIGHGARHKVGKRRGCSLPSDSLTNKQIQNLEGDVTMINLNEPVSYEQFKKLSDGLKTTYINNIIQKYHVGFASIARMMGCKADTLRFMIRNHHLDVPHVSKRIKKENEIAFERDYMTKQQKGDPAVEKVDQQQIAERVTETKPSSNLGRYEFCFDHVTSWPDILKFLGNMPLPNNAAVMIRVEELK